MKITLEFNSEVDTSVQYQEAGRMLMALAGIYVGEYPKIDGVYPDLGAPHGSSSGEKAGHREDASSEVDVRAESGISEEDKQVVVAALARAGFTVPETTQVEPVKAVKPEPAEGKTRTRRTKAQMDAYRAALAAGKSEAEAEAISYSIPREDAAPKSEAKSASDSFFDDPEPEPNITASPEDRVDPSEVITKEDIPKLLRRVAVLPPGDANRAYANKWIVQLLESKYGVRGTVNLKPDQYAPFYHEVRAELDRLGV